MGQKIGVVGLGTMGSALARAQLNAGNETRVWNRTPQKAEVLVSEGAVAEETAAQVAFTSDVVLVCVNTYDSAVSALGPAWEAGALDGRVVVQLGTTSPAEARLFAAKVQQAGGYALDGAMLFYPDSVGPENPAPLMVGGDQAGLEIARPSLKHISGNLMALGENIAAPAALDLGFLTMSIALYAGAAHAARLCEVEGADLRLLSELSEHGPKATDRLNIIASDAFTLGSLHTGAPLAVWADVAANVQRHAVEAAIDDHVSQSLQRIFDRAVDAGFGAEDVAALVKTLR